MVSTVTNGADGSIVFPDLIFSTAGVYEYRIQEIYPTTPDSHIIYDLLPVRVVINVVDRNSVLVADVTYSREAKFVNRFQYKEAEADISVTKVLNGMQLVNGMFEFELLSPGGEVLKTASNDANGKVNFTDMTFDEMGSFSYKIREVIPKEDTYYTVKYMTFDTKVIDVNVVVTDNDGNGDLEADVTYSVEPKFYNSYKIKGVIQ